jgi:RHS repeat-associated protein
MKTSIVLPLSVLALVAAAVVCLRAETPPPTNLLLNITSSGVIPAFTVACSGSDDATMYFASTDQSNTASDTVIERRQCNGGVMSFDVFDLNGNLTSAGAYPGWLYYYHLPLFLGVKNTTINANGCMPAYPALVNLVCDQNGFNSSVYQLSDTVFPTMAAGPQFTFDGLTWSNVANGDGSVNRFLSVNATNDGAPWPASGQTTTIAYSVTGPQAVVIANTIPATLASPPPPGVYTLSYASGGPSTSRLYAVSPSASQTLSAGQSITFTLQFKTALFINLSVSISSPGVIPAFSIACSGSDDATMYFASTDQSNTASETVIERRQCNGGVMAFDAFDLNGYLTSAAGAYTGWLYYYHLPLLLGVKNTSSNAMGCSYPSLCNLDGAWNGYDLSVYQLSNTVFPTMAAGPQFTFDGLTWSNVANGDGSVNRSSPTFPPPATTTLGPASSVNPVGMTKEPVNTATGDYFNSSTDLSVPGKGLSFVFARSYNSQDAYSGPMGAGWTHWYNIYLTVDGSGNAGIKQADGHTDYYAPAAGGAYTAQTVGLFNTLVKNSDGSFTLTFKNQTTFNFSSAGALLTIVDRNGNTQTLTYNGSGSLASVTDPSGRVFNFAYDGSGRVISLTDPAGRVLQYTYDTSGNLASFQDALGNKTQYTYDASHHMTSATDPRGNVYMQNVYDSANPSRVIQQTNARGFQTSFAYNTPALGTTTITDPLGNATQNVYDSGQRLVSIVNAQGGATGYTYYSNNLKQSATDALGNTTSYTYDNNGNLLTSTDASGNTTTCTYDTNNDLLSATDPLNRQTTFTYDAKGNLLTAQDAAGDTTTNTYDSSGLLLTTTDARSFTTAYQYDSYGNRTKVTDALSDVTQMTYDAVGHLLTTKNALGKIWTRNYDADDRLLSADDPLGDKTSYSYDANGNRTPVTDANGNSTQYSYDVNNNLSQVTDATSGVTAYWYNGNDDQTSVTDANGHVTTLAYDTLRRLQSRTDPLGRAQRYAYDAAGNLTSTIDGNGLQNTYTYDTLNRRIGASLSDGTTLGYTYDAAGNRLTMTDWRGTTIYSYDALNRVTSVTQPGSSVVSYGYDAVGNRTSITYPDGNIVHYQYDALSRLSQVTDWSTQTPTSGYDAAGNLVSAVYPNGTSTAYAYDAAGRLLNVTNRTGEKVNSAYTYVMDKVGNRLEVASYNEGVERYGYDRLYRLTSWTSPSRQAVRYAYDPVGNRLSMTEPTGTVNYAYDVADELLTAGGTTFTYDGNGNQLTKTAAAVTLTYGWDALNRLLSVTGGSVNTQYQYDGDGNRISQQTPAGTYAYANDTKAPLPVVLNESGPDGNIDYAWGSSLISASATGLQSFYQSDGLGSVATVTDQTGSAKASYAYDPWGTQVGTDSLGTKNKYKFTGEAVDPNTGLVFLRARFYDPGLGRFLARDSASGSLQTGSAYLYTLGNPSRLIDPNGHGPFDFIAKLFDFASAADGMRQQRQDALNCIMNDPSCDVDAAARTYYGVERQAAQQAAGVAIAGGEAEVDLSMPTPEFEPGTAANYAYKAIDYAMTASDLHAAVQTLRGQPSVPGADSPYQANAQGPSLPTGGPPIAPSASTGYSPPKIKK